jgi:hypothetical protein
MNDPTLSTVTDPVAVPHLNTVSEAAKKLRRSKSWVFSRIAKGELETVRFDNRSRFITDSELAKFIAKHSEKTIDKGKQV